ncbi:MAG TPA: phosphate propanoyltransferase [Clostridiales bacterium]|nr:phosphate propanoyltransferase [Clostridiales bacterium]
MNEKEIAALVAKVMAELEKTNCCSCNSNVNGDDDPYLVPVGVSNRHIHLSQADFETLFGKGATMTHFKDLSQPGQFACQEVVTLVGPGGAIERVRLLGPARKQSQIEVSVADCFKLGVKAPLRDSGDLSGSAALTMVGPAGSVSVPEGCIIALKHIHMHTSDAERIGLKDKDHVDVQTCGDRNLIFQDVLIRASENFKLEMHVDMDEANAASLTNGDHVRIIGKSK